MYYKFEHFQKKFMMENIKNMLLKIMNNCLGGGSESHMLLCASQVSKAF